MFFKTIKDSINRKVNYIVNRQSSSSQSTFSYLQLSNLFKEDVFIPLTSWSMSPNLMLHVLNDIEINNRKCIVEFGAVRLTIYIAKLLKMRFPNAVFYSVESDQLWADKISEQLETLQLSDYVTIIAAPKQNVPKDISYKDQKMWYDKDIMLKALENVEDIDLVLVDGPSGDFTPYCRYSAVPFLKSKLASSFSVFLDDINRPQEKELASIWHKSLECKVRYMDQYAHLFTLSSYGMFPYKV